ncbi:MAG TPA: type II secretion system protein [Blastocatellia bacterium]|nr:type II secretion system protein [Blastocatellia bacterium]
MLYPLDKKRSREGGFTLLELVMVMTIIVILAAVSVSSYQQMQLRARETILKNNLQEMRKLIDQYAADKEKLPQSLDDLVSAHYLREVPIDPITGERDWVLEMDEDDVSLEGGSGVTDVQSNAPGVGSDGIPYKDY